MASMSEEKKEVEVGQVLYLVFRHGRPYWATISKIGSRWIHTNAGDRIDKNDLTLDGKGYESPGRAYLSQEEHEKEQRRDKAWLELRWMLRDKTLCPAHISTETVLEWIEMLKGEKSNEQ